MITRPPRVVLVLALTSAMVGVARAQEKPPDAPRETATVPLRVQVVIARYQGDKRISNLPYLLSVNAGKHASIRMGTRVPVASTSYTPIAPGGAGVNPLVSYQYTDVGTNIDCGTAALDDGRFRVELIVEDSSPEDQPGPSIADRPSFRSFRAANSLVLKDGQTAQFTTAVDKVTGIVTKVDVTLTVVK